jgi:DNA gyrase subunit B
VIAVLPLRGKILNVEKARIDKVLQNTEVQALITAIGTGVRDEFDIERARYHKVILMTDADVDGAHIRTLVLTLLFREMQELIDAGYVYIAKPPLYKLKAAGQERYIERESELEEVLLADKFEKFTVADRDGRPFKLTEARWQAFRKSLKRYGSLATALRGGHGQDVVRFLEESALLDEAVLDADEAAELLSRPDHEGEHLTTELVERDDERLLVKAIERATGLAQTHAISADLFAAPEYRSFVKVHQDLVRLAGTPPFHVTLGERTETAASFETLRTSVLALAQRGVQLSRFKGLGEMNADQLRETTMDPASRTLQKVTIEDATAADQIFSMLMGDVVEPRREFIETNARDVVNLDV